MSKSDYKKWSKLMDASIDAFMDGNHELADKLLEICKSM